MSSHHCIDYLEIPVTSIEASRTFYHGVFGWSFTEYGPNYVSFDDGRLTGGLRKEDSVQPGGVLVVFYSRDLEATQAAVLQAGGKVVKAIFSFPGGRRFHFTDPSGHELAVWSE